MYHKIDNHGSSSMKILFCILINLYYEKLDVNIYSIKMRPKVSRGIKSTESTKNLAILGNKGTKQQDSFLIEELDLCRLNSKKETINGINTCRTEISNSNYTSRTNQSDKRIL